MSHEEETAESADHEGGPGNLRRRWRPEEDKRKKKKTTVGPLTLLRDDLSQFKDEVLRALKDRGTEPEAPTANRASALSILRDDLSQLRDEVSAVFRDATSEMGANRLSLSIDANLFRLPRLRDDMGPAPLDGPTLQDGPAPTDDAPKAKDDDTFGKLLERETLKSRNGQEVTKSQNQSDDSSDRKLPMNQEVGGVDSRRKDPSEEGDVEVHLSEETTDRRYEGPQTEEMRCSTGTGRAEQKPDQDSVAPGDESDGVEEEEEKEEEEKEEEKEEKGPGLVHLENLISALNLREENKDVGREVTDGDVWSVKNCAIYLTFDPSTANSELLLSNHNRTVTRVWSDSWYAGHVDRFRSSPQLLCREGLLDSAYWEAEWSGDGADVGVAYNSLPRDGPPADCLLGHNCRSWSLECSERGYTPCHRNRRFRASRPCPFSRRVGVHLDWSAGSLTFYCVSADAMVHLHTFTTAAFTEPLYPGFWLWAYDGSVTLCQVQLHWERLLQ